MSLLKKLAELQERLPDVVRASTYEPAVRSGKLIFVSGQLARSEGRMAYRGHLGKEINLESGRRAARLALLNALAALHEGAGSLDKVKKILKMTLYVASAPGFTEQLKVLTGAAELVCALFGEAHGPSATAIGVSELPEGSAVSLDLIAEL